MYNFTIDAAETCDVEANPQGLCRVRAGFVQGSHRVSRRVSRRVRAGFALGSCRVCAGFTQGSHRVRMVAHGLAWSRRFAQVCAVSRLVA